MALAEGHLLSLLGLLPTCFASIRFLVRGGGAMQDSRKHFIFFYGHSRWRYRSKQDSLWFLYGEAVVSGTHLPGTVW
jgi:hypothetical protein